VARLNGLLAVAGSNLRCLLDHFLRFDGILVKIHISGLFFSFGDATPFLSNVKPNPCFRLFCPDRAPNGRQIRLFVIFYPKPGGGSPLHVSWRWGSRFPDGFQRRTFPEVVNQTLTALKRFLRKSCNRKAMSGRNGGGTCGLPGTGPTKESFTFYRINHIYRGFFAAAPTNRLTPCKK
jgi:hypothetical protein